MVTMNRLLADHFRCLEMDVEFDWTPTRTFGHGYSCFGNDLVFYARSSTSPLALTAGERLYDALSDVRVEQSRCVLPFDPVEVIGDLRRERYARTSGLASEGNVFQRLTRGAYYMARPYFPLPIRKHLHRVFFARRLNTDFPSWPVDCAVDRLLEKLLALSLRTQGLERIPFIWFWPEGHSSAAILTHDVEKRAGVLACSALMDIDEHYGIRSSFQFIPETRYTVPGLLLKEIRHRGFEINIHDLNHDGRLYWTRKEFVRRAAKINRYAREFGASGFRAGVLYRNLDWYDAFDFSYDMSVPSVGHLAPQAGGCCTVMPYFIGRILELPLTTTEDYLLFQVLGEYSLDLWRLQIQMIQDRHGLISFLTHPDYLGNHRARATYRELLAYLSHLRSQEGVWVAPPGRVNEWWRARSQMALVRKHGTWQVEGPDSERARIAYASLDGDGVRYTIEQESRPQRRFSRATHSVESPGTKYDDTESSVSAELSFLASAPAAQADEEPKSVLRRPSRFGRHISFALLCLVSAIALAGPLYALATLAYHSEYYSHTVIIPFLVCCLILVKRKTVFAECKASLRLGIPLLTSGLVLFTLEKWAFSSAEPASHLSAAILALALFWIGSFAFCYGNRAFRMVLFPLLLLFLMVPLPMAAMDDFVHVTRVGSTWVASTIFRAFGVPVYQVGFLFLFPKLSIEVAKDCSGIHSTIALFVLSLMCGYLFLTSTWKRVVLVLCVFPIVSLTNGLRIGTLGILAEYVDRNILYSPLHRDGGILFFLLAFGLIAVLIRLLSVPRRITECTVNNMQHRITAGHEDFGTRLR